MEFLLIGWRYQRKSRQSEYVVRKQILIDSYYPPLVKFSRALLRFLVLFTYPIAGYFRGVYISRTACLRIIISDTEPRLLHITRF